MTAQMLASDLLLQAAQEVFETMVFMDLDKAEWTDQRIEGESLLGSITFTGPMEGCLSVCCDLPCARSIALNMLGLDSPNELSEADVYDAMGEIANMIMGSLKARLGGEYSNLQVSIPSVVSGQKLETNLGEQTHRLETPININGEYLAKLTLHYRQGGQD